MEDFGGFGPVIAWLAAVVVAFGPGSQGLKWIVDRVRDALPDKLSDNNRYRIVWPALAFVIALLSVLAFPDLNVIGGLFDALPRSPADLSGTFGDILSAVGYAGFASHWHDKGVQANPPGPRVL